MSNSFSFKLISIVILISLAACTTKEEKAREEIRKGEKALFTSMNDKALEHFSRAIKLDPDNAAIYIQRASVLANLKRYDESLADLEKSIALNPNDAEAWFVRGNIYTILGKRDEACRDYISAFKLGKKNIYDKVKHCPDAPQRVD